MSAWTPVHNFHVVIPSPRPEASFNEWVTRDVNMNYLFSETPFPSQWESHLMGEICGPSRERNYSLPSKRR